MAFVELYFGIVQTVFLALEQKKWNEWNFTSHNFDLIIVVLILTSQILFIIPLSIYGMLAG